MLFFCFFQLIFCRFWEQNLCFNIKSSNWSWVFKKWLKRFSHVSPIFDINILVNVWDIFFLRSDFLFFPDSFSSLGTIRLLDDFFYFYLLIFFLDNVSSIFQFNLWVKSYLFAQIFLGFRMRARVHQIWKSWRCHCFNKLANVKNSTPCVGGTFQFFIFILRKNIFTKSKATKWAEVEKNVKISCILIIFNIVI